MNEKKLTDEELLRLLEIFAKDDEPNGVRLLAEGALDLIHRLQAEKKELKSIAEYQQGSNMERWRIIQEKDKTIAEQKAEIERLTEENEYLDGCAKQFLADYQNEQVKESEMEQRYLEESKERCKFEQLYNHKCHEHNIGLGVQRKHWEKKVEQAVKGTAKEIEQELEDKGYFGYGRFTIGGNDFMEIFKKRGVEVE